MGGLFGPMCAPWAVFCLVLLAAVMAGENTPPGTAPTTVVRSVECQGRYARHLQGICVDARDAVFWSFTTALVKTDARGKVLKTIPVASHHGDLCYHQGAIYVAVNLGQFNDAAGNADSWGYVYDAADLSFLRKHATPEVCHGAGGIGVQDGQFIVVGGLPEGVTENRAYQYDADFRFVKTHAISSGYTLMGIQTATFAGGFWWFGCYGNPRIVLKTDQSFGLLGKYELDCSLGIVGLADGRFLVARGRCENGSDCSGRAVLARTDAAKGLVIDGEDR